ncbi:amino acid ABC transporter substrate-binding protein [Agarivorans sp. Alg241-V36]|uniref:amino acid ABC transporter substrate-binding protein n=1 Tax=Agarivorans sp. Alg241-V36 TaxID=2305992 RepID=UPI0013D3FE2F|nr:amino acid ABC transporter substrate-binding protein [Agarivorans sp. Alg241-V36]
MQIRMRPCAPQTFAAMLMLSLLLPYGAKADSPQTISYPKFSQRSEYFEKVLALALAKTENEYGVSQLRPYERELSNERLRRYLQDKQYIDVMWSTATKQRNQALRPVKFDLLQGLGQYRFLLVQAGDSKRFEEINSLRQLRQFSAGSGTYWSDTKVMRYNGIEPVTSVNHSLLPMLAAGRFDYLSRGAHEVWSELAAHANQFELLDNVVLKYSCRYFFYVNKDNVELAERLEKGLYLALNDGSYNQLFFSESDFKQGWDKLNELAPASVITLNPPKD